jgi:hypothetical protein
LFELLVVLLGIAPVGVPVQLLLACLLRRALGIHRLLAFCDIRGKCRDRL